MKSIHAAAAVFIALGVFVIVQELRADRPESGMNGVAQEAKHLSASQNVAVVVGRLPDREVILANIRIALRHAKVSAVFMERDRLQRMPADDLLAYRALVIAEDDMDGYSAPALGEYARRGGGVIFLRYAKLGQEFMEMAGLAMYGNEFRHSQGFGVAGGFLFNNRRLELKGIELSVKEARVNGANVFARLRSGDQARAFPLGWTRRIGEGGVLFWNTDQVAGRASFRGLIVQSLHHLCRGFITGLANVGMIMIDDLPGSWPGRMKGSAKKTGSPRDTWTKGIDDLERRFGFNYTSYLIMRGYRDSAPGSPRSSGFHHEGVVVPPSGRGTAAAKKGWELGIHALSFANGERAWAPDALAVSLKEWEAKFGKGNPPVSCAIQGVDINRAAQARMGDAFPSIKAIRLPVGAGSDFGKGADDRHFKIPVISSGFSASAESEAALWGELHAMGVVSHRLSPDEYIPGVTSRGGADWNRFAGRFVEKFERVRADYPWLRWLTVSGAVERLRAYDAAELRAQRDGRVITIHVDNCGEPVYFRTRLNPGEQIRKVEGCGLVNIHRDSGDIVFKSYGRVSRVVLR